MNSPADPTLATTLNPTVRAPGKNRFKTGLWIIVALFAALIATGVYMPQHAHHAIFRLAWRCIPRIRRCPAR